MLELEVWLCPVHKSLDDSGGIEPLDNCVACLRAERNELRADKERMDFLQARKYFCAGINHHGGRWVYQIETGGYAERGETLRDAVDAAMRPESLAQAERLRGAASKD